ncbi:hypothetical protein V5F69_20665, partial [Xanthobacter sp. V2C-4]
RPSSPDRKRSFLAGQQARLPPSCAAAAAPRTTPSRKRAGDPGGCSRPVRRLSTAIEAASGGFGQSSGDTTMAQIGTFTRDENGAYAGTIKTLTL